MIAKKKDKNQQHIELMLNKLGITFADTSACGNGFPDMVVGFRGHNYLLEIKQTPKHKLTPKQIEFQGEWDGQYTVVYSWDDVMEVIGFYV